jgi:hypothetical protein
VRNDTGKAAVSDAGTCADGSFSSVVERPARDRLRPGKGNGARLRNVAAWR